MVRIKGLLGVGLAAAIAMIGLAAPAFADSGTATGDNTTAVTTPSVSPTSPPTSPSPSPSTTHQTVVVKIQPSTVVQGGQVKISACFGTARSAAFGRIFLSKPWNVVTVRASVAPGRYPVFVACANGPTGKGLLTVTAAQQTTTPPVGGIGTGGGGAASQIG